jgi:hypothetical protein
MFSMLGGVLELFVNAADDPERKVLIRLLSARRGPP